MENPQVGTPKSFPQIVDHASGVGAVKVLVTSRSFGSGSRDLLGELAAAGASVVRGPATHDLDELAPLLASADGWIAGTGPVTDAHLAAAPGLRIVARYGVGVDAVDLDAAARRGVTVTNTPGANTEAVADLALALLLGAVRGVGEGDRRVRSGDWRPVRGRELSALHVGVAGLGRIGQAFARRVLALGCRVSAYDPYSDASVFTELGAFAELIATGRGAGPDTGQGAAGGARVRRVELGELSACDAVSLHAPGGAVLVDDAWLAGVAPGLVLVNTARADLIDEAAVAKALRDERLGAYAADTLAAESGGDDGVSPLLASDLAGRVTVTPHIGAQTIQAIDRMGAAAAADVLAVLGGRPPRHLVAGETQ